jgi:UDP:flavonoid glycosyltransferase YjiC (YdhE family)
MTPDITTEEPTMRILFTSTAGLGHVHPLLPFIRAAQARGHEARLAITVEAQPAATRFGVQLVPTAAPSPADSGAFWGALPDQDDQDSYVIGRWFGGLVARATLPAIHAEVEEWQPDLVVSEAGEVAGALCAEAAGIPHVTVGVTALATEGYTSQRLIDEVNEGRRMLGLADTDQPPWLRSTTRYVTAVPRVLWGSPDEAPADTVVLRHDDPEGPVPVAVPQPRDGGRRPTVYATLGTAAPGFHLAGPAFAAVLAGLGQLDVDVLFTVGSFDVASLGPVPANVKVESYVPQSVAMACDAVVTHGGSGTTIAALTRGLPQVVVPLFADQPHNAERIAAEGIGLAVDVRSAAETLAPAVRRVLDEPSFGSRAREVAADLAGLPSADQVLAELLPVAVH